MIDEKKQIEEMAVICGGCKNTCDECFESYEKLFLKKIKNREKHCQAIAHSKNLYKQNYRKIPEGAVVLTREEYEEQEKKIREQAQIESVEIYKNALIAERAKARKETAREIIEYLQDNGRKYETWYLIYELKKQCGVEVEE